MKNWSSIQPADLLEFSRKYVFVDELLPNFLRGIGAKEGMEIADIGCGTGCFTRFLYRGMNENSKVYGIDLDESFLTYAKAKKAEENLGDNLIFMQGNAYVLPFDNDSLDVVTDHTLMINLSEPHRFIDEELRILKPGGSISTVTFLTDYSSPERLFSKPEFQPIYEVQAKTRDLMKKYIFNQSPIGANDINIYKIADIYRQHGIRDIRINGVFPIFSPDDDRYKETRLEWLTIQYNIQKWELQRFLSEIERWKQHGLTEEELRQALKLIEERYHYECNNCTWIFSNQLELIISGKK